MNSWRITPLALIIVACASPSKPPGQPLIRDPQNQAKPPAGIPAEPVRLGAPELFSFAELTARAEHMATQSYEPPPLPPSDVLERIDYDAHGKLKYKPARALFQDGPGRFPVTFFHLGRYFRIPVRMYLVASSGEKQTAREVVYDESYFEMPEDSPAHELPRGSGFAGFRFQESRLGDQARLPWEKNDWVAFLGATYFRAIGDQFQYGLSARAVALDVAVADSPEEFPSFVGLYIEQPEGSEASVTVYGLFDSPSIVGAVRFVMRRESAVVMDVTESLFLRRDVKRLGIAPLTSMYWFSEKSKDRALDWRPEVHDSDGLALETGTGEQIWRPLNNPPRTIASAFVDANPRGFGLSQRDRDFENYLDGVRYERRPSLWVEPIGAWGPGAVALVEIPTDDEVHDNIVAMWVPEAPARAGMRYDVRYRLHWRSDEPRQGSLARVVATRVGRGGEPGRPRPSGVKKFVVEVAGEALSKLPYGTRPEIVLWSSRGTFSNAFTEAVPNDVPGHWRAQFDLSAEGVEPVEMRMYLRLGDEAVSETWLYQWHPR